MDALLKGIMIFLTLHIAIVYGQPYQLIDETKYRDTVAHAQQKINKLLPQINHYAKDHLNTRIQAIIALLADTPFSNTEGVGEGDWQPNSPTYQPGALHFQQQPVYRLDHLNCQSFVETVMALLYAKTLSEFESYYTKISYGALVTQNNHHVTYINRNHFIEADFNPVNQRNGLLKNVMLESELKPFTRIHYEMINRKNWFLKQSKQSHVVKIFKEQNKNLVENFKILSQHFHPNFAKQDVAIAYLPKSAIAMLQPDGTYRKNQALLDKIPTPALAEIVSDANLLYINHHSLRDILDTELSITHFGILYQDTFHQGDIIYHQILCDFNGKRKYCQVKKKKCLEKICRELMFAHATSAYPDGYFWYQQNGNYQCSFQLPSNITKHTLCNRVERLPLYAYLTSYHYGKYVYMQHPSFLGVHIEKLIFPKN